jgi:uncharacterized protein (TIGR02246 family)
MLLGAILVFVALAGQAAPMREPSKTSDDRVAAEAATQAYRTAWLTNDPATIMATLTPDAIMFPSAMPPIVGADAIRKFWFPATTSTRVVDMELKVDNIHVDGDTAVTSGMGSLTFVVTASGVAAAPRTQRHWHVNVLRRQPDGAWKIWRRMWGDLR